MNSAKIKQQKKDRRHKRIRSKVFGTAERPRLSFNKSNKYLRAQVIDDEQGVTLAAAMSGGAKGKTQTELAHALGKELAKKTKTKKITTVVFDRGGALYTGKVKAFADGAREEGLNF